MFSEGILLGLDSKSFGCPGSKQVQVQILVIAGSRLSTAAGNAKAQAAGKIKGRTRLPFQAVRVTFTAQVFPNLVTAQCV